MGKDKRNYNNDTLVPETYLDDRGFPVYRRTQKDLRVVPHNRLMLLDCDGHVKQRRVLCQHVHGIIESP